MTTRTTIRSWPAMGLAGVFLAGTSFVLFNDIAFGGAPITTGHVLTALALIAATAAGHQIVTTFRARRYFNGIGMVLLTAAALAYVATMSGARNAEQAGTKAERIGGSNAERERIAKLREQAQAMLDAALRDVARKCEGGDGKNCKGAKATRDVYEAAVKGHNADIAKLPAQQTPNAGYKAAAEAIVLAGLTDRAQTDVEKALIVLLPWLAVLIAELGTIVFLSSALGHKEIEARKTTTSVPSFSDSAQTSFSATAADDVRALLTAPLPEPENDGPIPPLPPTGGKRRDRKATTKVERKTTATNVVPLFGAHPVIRALADAGRFMTNGELAIAMGCSDSEASKRCKEVIDQLDMGWNGRFRSIGLKAWASKAAAV